MKPERVLVGKRVKERRNPAGESREGSEAGELQGERKDTRDGERARTRDPRTAGGRGLNRAGDRVLLHSLAHSARERPSKKTPL